MFAGLPGIGVGTLFYVLMAFWMPVREIPRVIQGTSTVETWKLILRQMFYAVGIIVTVMFAERLMLWVLGQSSVHPFSPSSWLYTELGHRANGSLLAAPIMASVILLVGVIGSVEVLRIVMKRPERVRREQPEITTATFPDGVLDSTR
jgi:predicted membrane channel-forming protein YqfA (hemolysin III family)